MPSAMPRAISHSTQFTQFLKREQYSYKLFDTYELLKFILKAKKKSAQAKKIHEFIIALETAIKVYRNCNRFVITDLIKEYLASKPNSTTKYSIIYKNNIIISTCRIIYTKTLGYFNLVYTNSEYRNKKICQTHIQHLINCFKLPIYELHVIKNNVPAIKCYKNLGFINQDKNQDKKNNFLMRLKI